MDKRAKEPMAFPPPSAVEASRNGEVNYDIDEIFKTRAIPEVKAIQRRLQADADTKQEELRHMVGERYRDLLQASTSIISISRSSRRVMGILKETKEIILAEEPPAPPQRISTSHADDVQLRTLQVLSAHIKLLLDAPEHLWRLIERKCYFSASWLFLLARVVHRALIREDDQDEDGWDHHGINVLAQFPLVQRQWDNVAQFRPQIIHKATLSLRECSTVVEDTCATLLALHLLESRPLAELLSLLLNQRSKTVQTILSPPSDQVAEYPGSHVLPVNGDDVPETWLTETKGRPAFRRTTVRHYGQVSQAALENISSTLFTCRRIFERTPDSERPMIGHILERIQSDHPEIPRGNGMTSPELRLTTQALLSNLPSSTLFLSLPSNLRSYKPYVDLNSSSAVVPQDFLNGKLEEWFQKSATTLRVAVERWFSELHSAKEVWNVRTSSHKSINAAPGPTEAEKVHLKAIFDNASKQRILEVWRDSLSLTETAFQEQLRLAMKNTDSLIDTPASEFLFTPTLPSSFTPASSLPLATSDPFLQKYTINLRRQLNGRTPTLNNLLNLLEQCADDMNNDVSELSSSSSDDYTVLVTELVELYRPFADAFCTTVLGVLEDTTKACYGHINNLVFLCRLTYNLTSTLLPSNIHCSDHVAVDFRERMRKSHDFILGKWREYIVRHTVSGYCDALPRSYVPSLLDMACTGPSSMLVDALLSLATSIQSLGIFLGPPQRANIACLVLLRFDSSVQKDAGGLAERNPTTKRQVEWDLSLLRQLVQMWKDSHWSHDPMPAGETIAPIPTNPGHHVQAFDTIDPECSEYIRRSQVFLEYLLPPSVVDNSPPQSTEKLAPLLCYGIPSAAQPQTALVSAKPLPRFGLLLVNT